MNQNDEKYFKNLALKVLEFLDTQDFTLPFVVDREGQTYDLKSGGWAVRLGTFRGYQCSAQIWFDQFTAHEERKICYCIYSNHSEGIKKLVALSKPYLGSHISIYSSHWANNEQLIQLQKPMLKKEFGKPVFERYPKYKEYLYGVYVFERVGLQRNETQRLISRVLEFIITINNALSKDRMMQDAEAYETIENRKAVQKHLQRERRSHLATLRKQYDNFVCQICGFDYRKKYGELGDDFAEAHHIVPLSKNENQRISTIDDLITVCANCHRMLHRMNGKAGDITKLKKILNKNSKLEH